MDAEAPLILGNITGSVASLEPRGFQRDGEAERLDKNTGEIVLEISPEKGEKTSSERRAERYSLKAVVDGMYPRSRLSACHKNRLPGHQIKILTDDLLKRAHYAGAMQCGSVWACPLCAAKITERRRAELSGAMVVAKAKGWFPYLATFTTPHKFGDDCKLLVDRQQKAWRAMLQSRRYQKLRKLMGVMGHIRALEVTHGVNGFHPHMHVLVFLNENWVPGSVEKLMCPVWQDACERVGLERPSESHGCRVDDGSWAERYATKWGLEDEITRGHQKTSRGEKGTTPWGLLRDIRETDSQESRELFRAYLEAFKGRRQLYWSTGLREALGVEDKTDQELVEAQVEHASLLAEITLDQWRFIYRHKLRAWCLDMAEKNPADLLAWLEAIK